MRHDQLMRQETSVVEENVASEQYELANLSKTVEYPIQTESVINERRHSSYEQYDPSLDQHHQSQQRIHLFEEQQQHQHQQTSNNNDNTSNISYEEQVNVIIHQQTERIEFLENQCKFPLLLYKYNIINIFLLLFLFTFSDKCSQTER